MAELIKDACVDTPSETDYKHEEIFGADVGADKRAVCLSKTKAQDQGAQVETHYACTIYGLTHCNNEENYIESSRVGVTPVEKEGLKMTRDVVKADVGFKPTSGWSLQGAMDFFKKNGYIAGYAIVKGIDGIRKAIDKNQMVYTGSRNINWVQTQKNGNIAVRGSSYGHAFCIEGYDDFNGYVICRNSYGEKKYCKGRFFVKYEDLDILYTTYAIIDQNDSEELYAFKSIQKGIWNGDRPNDIPTRFETATMIIRASKKQSSEIWNGSNPDAVPSTVELETMQMRGFGKKDGNVITRKQLAVFCAKNS